MSEPRSGFVTVLIVAAAVVAVVCAHQSWVKRDRALPFGDENRYFAATDRAIDALRAPSFGATVRGLSDVHPTHPPLFPALAAAWTRWFDADRDGLRMLPLAFFVLLALATYRAGSILGSPTRGAAAVLLLAASPLVFRYTHRFFLEMAATAWTGLALWMVLAWREHGGWLRALCLGLFFGAGLLTKWTVSVFVLAPAFVVALQALKRDDASVLQLVAGLVFGGLLAAPWYVTHLEQLRAFIAWNQDHAYWELASLRTIEGWLFYVKRLPLMMGVIPFALFLIGGLVALVRWRRDGVLVAGVLIPLVTFTLFRTKAYDGRHLLPLVPAAMLLAGTVVRCARDYPRWAAWIAILAAVPLGLLPAAGLALESGPLRTPLPGTSVAAAGVYDAPAPHDDGAHAVFERIAADMESTGRAASRVFCVAAFGSLCADGLTELGRRRVGGPSAFNPEPRAAGESAEDDARWREIVDADYVVVKEGLVYDSNVNGYRDAYPFWADYFRGPSGRYPTPATRRVRAAYVMLEPVATPDGDTVWIARRRRALNDAERAEVVTVAARIAWLVAARATAGGRVADAAVAREAGARHLTAAVTDAALREAAIAALDITPARATSTWARLGERVRTGFHEAPHAQWRAFAGSLLDARPADAAWDDDAYAVILAAPNDDPLVLSLFQRWLDGVRARGELDRAIGFLTRRSAYEDRATRAAMEGLAGALRVEVDGPASEASPGATSGTIPGSDR